MRNLKADNDKGVLITYAQGCKRYNLGMSTIQKLAKDGECLVKIGKSARIDVAKMDSFVFSFRE